LEYGRGDRQAAKLYVCTSRQKGERIHIVIPKTLQMGWCESPPFLCSTTEIVRDIVEDFVAKPVGSLPEHPLEDMMLPPSKWPEDGLESSCRKYLPFMKVYVDARCCMQYILYSFNH